ncbi:hypothetical protein PSYJA_11575 [Pseudomonas syringae pv. japonica str. M301072]|uniref:Nucleotidyltransferase family protein n=1 Tax=Pseudomonas syringae pv. japonica str. M301072 TaxID=629262 RepID=F3FH89_PSESX|nr:hypothetical protein PSYJA_11575 [Pseudomonas syringae pv. japonica str. M301072]
MDDISRIQSIISSDPVRWRLLEIVHSLKLPDCWIGAGFVRNAVWDYLHGRVSSPVSTDVDVIWFNAERCTPEEDAALEAVLSGLEPTVKWSVKNQARMHIQNGDEPYLCAIDAMRYWPETATAGGLSGYETKAHARSLPRWELMTFWGWSSGQLVGLSRKKIRFIKTASSPKTG